MMDGPLPTSLPEPWQASSVTAELLCRGKNLRDVTGRLVRLGAVHILVD